MNRYQHLMGCFKSIPFGPRWTMTRIKDLLNGAMIITTFLSLITLANQHSIQHFSTNISVCTKNFYCSKNIFSVHFKGFNWNCNKSHLMHVLGVETSGRSRISHWGGLTRWGGGTNLQCIHFSAKTYAKTKEIDPVGGRVPRRPPMDPPMETVQYGNSTYLTFLWHDAKFWNIDVSSVIVSESISLIRLS